MGALTLKTFPFELRGWEIEKFNSINITDSFGSTIKLCLNNKTIIQIEPTTNSTIPWLDDKARQFFDSLTNKSLNYKQNSWNKTIKTLAKTIYLFELCNLKYKLTYFFIIIYENISKNLFSLLLLYSKKYNFIKLKKSENKIINNNLEYNFLLNKNLTKKNKISLCLLIANNPRFESSFLNLNLKQKILEGNFKCFIIGSYLNLTYNINFIGKNTIKILKTVIEGKHFFCQDLILAKNPMVFVNSEFFKRKEGKNLIQLFYHLNKLNLNINLNIINSSIFEPSTFFYEKSNIIKINDFSSFSSLYLVNLTSYSNKNITKIIKTSVFYSNLKINIAIKSLYINQNVFKEKNIFTKKFRKNFDKYLYIPTKTVFETTNTFLNTQGLIKQINNTVLTNIEIKSSWQILRILFNNFKKKLTFLDFNTQFKNSLNLNKKNTYLNFQTFKNFSKKIISHSLNVFKITKPKLLKIKKIKFYNTKIKFWLNDFFTGGKDNFSKNSLIMIKCSNIKRNQLTNFF